MLEKEMYIYIKKYLEEKNYIVYGEVLNSDVVGINEKTNESILIEMKKQLNFKVLEQIFNSIGYAKYLYILIPFNKKHPYGNPNHRFAYFILREYGIGLLYLHEDGSIKTYIESVEFETIIDIKDKIRDYNKKAIGGSKSGDTVTEYSMTRNKVKSYMENKEWVTIDDILKEVKTHWKNEKNSLAADLRAKHNNDWCEWKKVGRKTYYKLKKE